MILLILTIIAALGTIFATATRCSKKVIATWLVVFGVLAIATPILTSAFDFPSAETSTVTLKVISVDRVEERGYQYMVFKLDPTQVYGSESAAATRFSATDTVKIRAYENFAEVDSRGDQVLVLRIKPPTKNLIFDYNVGEEIDYVYYY